MSLVFSGAESAREDHSTNQVGRMSFESAVSELDKSINANANAILENQDLMAEKLSDGINDLKGDLKGGIDDLKDDVKGCIEDLKGDLKEIISNGSRNGITLDYMVMALRKTKAKVKRLQLSLDQEEQKRGMITRDYNKNMQELRLENQALTSENSELKKAVQISSILRSIDQKLDQNLVQNLGIVLGHPDAKICPRSEV